MGFPRLWSPITLRANFGSQCSLKQSCSSCQELSNNMSHAFCSQVNRVDSQLFMVESRTNSLIPCPSFGHNLCFKCSNEQCKPILTSTFQQLSNHIKNTTSHWVLTPEITLWSFGNPPRLHLPKWELPWECEGSLFHTPSHFLTLLGICDVIPGLFLALIPRLPLALTHGLPLGPQPCNPFALVVSPKLG